MKADTTLHPLKLHYPPDAGTLEEHLWNSDGSVNIKTLYLCVSLASKTDIDELVSDFLELIELRTEAGHPHDSTANFVLDELLAFQGGDVVPEVSPVPLRIADEPPPYDGAKSGPHLVTGSDASSRLPQPVRVIVFAMNRNEAPEPVVLKEPRKMLYAVVPSLFIMPKLLEWNYSDRAQILDALRLLVSHSADELNRLVRADHRILIVKIPRERLKRWHQFLPAIYAMSCLPPECSSETVRAGIVFSIAPAKNVQGCLRNFKSHYDADDPVLVIHDMLRDVDCPTLFRMLERSRRG